MKSTTELQDQIRACGDPAQLRAAEFTCGNLPELLRQLIADGGLTPKEIIFRCNFDRSYGYQLLNGTRTPTRGQLVALALVLGLEQETVQRLLKMAGRPVLYARNRADAAVLYGLAHGLSLQKTDELLKSLGEEGLL